MRVRVALYAVALCLCAVPMISAQDAVKVDPKHYSVMSENDQVRILKAHDGAHEKSVMHSHPDVVAVSSVRQGYVHLPRRQEAGLHRDCRHGDVLARGYSPAGKHG